MESTLTTFKDEPRIANPSCERHHRKHTPNEVVTCPASGMSNVNEQIRTIYRKGRDPPTEELTQRDNCYASAMLNRRQLKSLVVSCVASVLLLSATPSANAASWVFTDESVNLGLSGVSPHVERVTGGDRVWRADMVPSGTAVTLCNDAGVCAPESFGTGPNGPVADFALAQTPSGIRAYFKLIDMASNTQGVYSAPCLTVDCLEIGAASLTSSGMVVSKDERAWGVPDPVRLPDGRIRIYIVESPVMSSSCPEKVASYISSDGVSFTKEAGWRLEGGYVDTEVLRASDGDWVMIVADGPGCGGTKGNQKPQQLYVTTSRDGLTWTKPKGLTGTDRGRLDPTGYEVSPNVFRIYYASGGGISSNFVLRRGTLSIGKSTSANKNLTKVKGKKKTTITCKKGKVTRKVTGVNPRCPKGFRKR